MPLLDSNYRRPLFLSNQHLETIYPALLRKVKIPSYQRERLELPDGDFLDIDWLKKKADNDTLVLISHGLEGDSSRSYMQGMAKKFWEQGWDALCWNYRGCSEEMNRLPRFYHSGATEDLAYLVQVILQKKQYKKIVLVGFSLGGNLTLKYLGEQGDQLASEIKLSLVFSVPLHLAACAHHLDRPKNWVYAKKFLSTLCAKVRQKSLKFPEQISTQALKKVGSLKDFDNYYTAPLHGFKDAEDYYHRSASIRYLKNIMIPTLVVNAQNDPFFPADCYPYELFAKIDHLFFETPAQGGHCGFWANYPGQYYWSEQRAWDFVEKNI